VGWSIVTRSAALGVVAAAAGSVVGLSYRANPTGNEAGTDATSQRLANGLRQPDEKPSLAVVSGL